MTSGGSQILFEGYRDPSILRALKACTQLEGGASWHRGKTTRLVSEQKLQSQRENWLNALLYIGYLDAQISATQQEGKKPLIRVDIRPGPLYTLQKLTVLVNGDPLPEHLMKLLPQLPCPAKTALVRQALDAVTRDYHNRGYPFARIESQEFTAEDYQALLTGNVCIATGPFCLFGDVRVLGLRRVLPDFVSSRVQVRPNAPVDLSQINESCKKLQASGLFNDVNIDYQLSDRARAGPEFVDLDISLHEAKSRSLGFGFNLATQNGFGIVGEWAHRNLKGRGENLTLNTLVSRRRHTTSLQYTQASGIPSEELQAQLRVLGSIDQDATRTYDATSWNLGMHLDHFTKKNFSWSKGLRIEQVVTRGALSFPTTALVGFPISLSWNSASDLLNPKQGRRCALNFTPLVKLTSKSHLFTKQELLLAQYIPLPKMTLALCAQIANFWGISRSDVPPSLRYYLGSSSSMRGYRYKSLSPLDSAKQPIGGCSLIALTLEPRLHLHSRMTLVPFLELGRVFESHFPEFGKRLFRSAGVGAYLKTPIGPFRIDIAIPLDRRVKLDRKLELYMSIGSSF